MMRAIHRFLALSRQDRRLFAEAALALLASRLAMAVLPVRIVFRWFGMKRATVAPVIPWPQSGGENSADKARAVTIAVRRAARNMPFEALCLVQGLAACWLLSRRNIACRLHLGVMKHGDEMQAHAWVITADGKTILGERGAGDYALVAIYGARMIDASAAERDKD